MVRTEVASGDLLIYLSSCFSIPIKGAALPRQVIAKMVVSEKNSWRLLGATFTLLTVRRLPAFSSNQRTGQDCRIGHRRVVCAIATFRRCCELLPGSTEKIAAYQESRSAG